MATISARACVGHAETALRDLLLASRNFEGAAPGDRLTIETETACPYCARGFPRAVA